MKHKILWLVLIFGFAAFSGCEKGERTGEVIPTLKKTLEQISTISPTKPTDLISASAPSIIEITFPDVVRSQEIPGMGEVHFADLEGDISSVQFTLLEGGCAESDYFAFDPMDVLSEGEPTSGAFRFEQYCIKCTDNRGNGIFMQVQLYDAAGNVSEAGLYSFLCE